MRSSEKGVILVLAAGTLIVVIAMAALVTDVGIMLLGRSDLAQAVDAAALGGAQELPDSTTAATLVATDYVNMNVVRQLYGAPDLTISFPSLNIIRVHATMPLPAMFARVLGLDAWSVGATAEATRFEPDVALVIDRSGSMCADTHGALPGGACPEVGPWEPFNSVQEAAKGFVDGLGPEANVALLSYATTATVDVPSTTDKMAIKASIDDLKPYGYTDIAASVEEAIQELLLLLGPNPKQIVLLTDGIPTVVGGIYVGSSDPGPSDNLLAAAVLAKESGIAIHSISYGNATDMELMSSVAEIAEGQFFHAPDQASLELVYAEISDLPYIRLTWVN